ncbi:YpmS family protein [Pseudolactococcus insecticola]|uniref:DUF2140 domain-containing protein n=1 Tax=Pseudolactococcus insecticola TaxID=2709158 RepID=A0A6A0B6H4_9LACT|nr:YpmS family protein [Lactococcus insecticola]GFH40108.1 hypothetical protein Hs20B_05060 [Lactococcus insecticola]
MKNKYWKYLFLLILAFNLAVVCVVGFQITKHRDQTVLSKVSVIKGVNKVADVSTNTEQLNSLINKYLADYQNDKMTYKFYLSDKAVLEGSYKIFGTKIPLYLYFEPYAMSDGSVELKVTSISIGSLSLPTKTVLSYVKNAYDLPAFVSISPKKQEVLIDLPKLAIAKDTFIQADKIDLKNGQFVFNLMQK